jgi:hypothetical protein
MASTLWQQIAALTTRRPPPVPLHGPLASARQISLLVATSEGLLYEYAIEDLAGPQGPRASLGGEWALLGSAGLG